MKQKHITSLISKSYLSSLVHFHHSRVHFLQKSDFFGKVWSKQWNWFYLKAQIHVQVNPGAVRGAENVNQIKQCSDKCLHTNYTTRKSQCISVTVYQALIHHIIFRNLHSLSTGRPEMDSTGQALKRLTAEMLKKSLWDEARL